MESCRAHHTPVAKRLRHLAYTQTHGGSSPSRSTSYTAYIVSGQLFYAPLRSPRPIWMTVRGWLWHQANGKCYWCGVDTHDDQAEGPTQATIDHVVPRSVGGPDKHENMVLACSQCNRRRNVEYQRGLPDGSLLGTFTTQYGKLTKKTQPPAVTKKAGSMTALDQVRNQRDQAVAELIKVRAQNAILIGERNEARSGCRRMREQMQNLSFREFGAIALRRWARRLR